MATKKMTPKKRTEYENKLNDAYEKISKTELGDDERLALFYAKEALRQIIYDPAKQTLGSKAVFGNLTKTQILGYLQNPSANEANLRKASNYLYITSQHYQRLIMFYSTLLLWRYVLVPDSIDEKSFFDETNIEVATKNYFKAANLASLMDVADTMREVSLSLMLEGVYYGVRWTDKKKIFFLQKIDPDFCRITAVKEGICLYSVDMSKIKKDDLWAYHEVFASMYSAYESTGVKYQEVPADVSFCLKADMKTLEYSIPPFAATMPQLYKIADAEARADVAADMDNYKMIHALIPSDEEGNPKIDLSLVTQFYNQMAKQLGGGVGLAVNPFKMDVVSFERSGATAEIDKVQRVVSQYWQTAGVQGTLFGISNNTTGIANLALVVDEAYMSRIMGQAQKVFNYILRSELSGKYLYKIEFLPITIFNVEKETKRYKEAATTGIAKFRYAACLGVTQNDLLGEAFIEKHIIKLDEILKPLKNTYNTASENEAGRPIADVVDDSGEKTRDGEGNDR